MIGRKKPRSSALEQARQTRRPRVVRSNVGSNTIRSVEPSRQQSPARANFLSRVVILVLIGALIFWSGYVGSIKTSIEGGEADASIEKSVKDHFSGIHGWWWFVSIDNATRQIKESNPYIADVTISRSLLTRDVIVSIKQRQAAIRLVADKRQYLVADDGVILGPSDNEANLPLVYDELSDPVSIRPGKPYLPSQVVTSIIDIKRQLGLARVKVKDFSLTDNTREVQAYIVDSKYFIKFTTNASIAAQVNDFKLVRDKGKLEGASEYVDVRFSGKVYIR